jgi:PAS domain S-box-containing protein
MKMQNDELLRVQEELETVRARYFDLYNLAPVGYLVVSSEGLIAEINLTAASLLGLPRAALIKQPITRFIHRDDQDIYYHHRRQLYLLTRPHACELRMMKSDGTSFWTLLTATAVEEDSTASREASWDTRVSRVVLSDISDPKRLEEENLALEAKLKRALEAAHSD